MVGFEDRYGRFLAVLTLTPWLFLPAYVAALVAVAQRRKALAGMALLLIACHLVWVWTDLPWSRNRQPQVSGPELTLVSVNAFTANSDPAALAQRLGRLRPDVLLVAELTPAIARALDGEAALDGLDSRMVEERIDGFGAGVYSRFPLVDRSYPTVAGIPMPMATVEVGGRSLRLMAVHTLNALSDIAFFRRGLSDIGAIAARLPRPAVVAGDFNASHQHRAYRGMLGRSGLRDSHASIGRGLATTWPVGRRIPPFALLDHVLVSPDIRVLAIRELDVPGSDHRAVVAKLRLP